MTLQVQVFNTLEDRRAGRAIFERIVEVPAAISVPYDRFTDVFRFLFSEKSIIQITVI